MTERSFYLSLYEHLIYILLCLLIFDSFKAFHRNSVRFKVFALHYLLSIIDRCGMKHFQNIEYLMHLFTMGYPSLVESAAGHRPRLLYTTNRDMIGKLFQD